MHNPKLRIPDPDRRLAPRNRCMKLLEREAHRPLIALTAPTGYGKTTLLAARAAELAARGAAVGWLALDADDNDAGRLLADIVSMLPPAARAKAEKEPPRLESTLEALNIAGEAYLFFDRYETVRSDAAHRLFEQLITHSGGRIRFCIASREKLPFAAALRRLQPALLTMTQEQLRLSPEEAVAFIRRRTRSQPRSSVLARLEQAAEGWPLALDVFASLYDGSGALPPGEDAAVDTLASRLQDIFLEDILAKQPVRLQQFMLRTSVPDAFDADLAREITGDDEAHGHQEYLLRQLLLLEREGDGQLRYPPLLARWLRDRFSRSGEAECREVRQRLIGWMERQGRPVEAVPHALDIHDYDRASKLLLTDISATFACPKRTVIDWLDRFPREEMSRRPSVAMLYGWFLTAEHRIAAAETVLDGAEAYMGEERHEFSPTGENLRGYFASIRSRIHFLRRESEPGMTYMKETEALLNGPGRLYSHLNTIDPCGSSLLNSDAGHWGALDQTIAMCEYAEPLWNGVNQGYGIIHVLLGECCFERSEQDRAETHLQKGRRIGLDLMDTGLILPATLALVQLKWSRGERQSAYVLLRETEKLIASATGEDGQSVLDACRARLHMKADRSDEARQWMRRRPAAIDSVPEMPKLYEALTHLRAFVCLRQFRQGIDFGEKLLHMSESWYLQYPIAEISLLLAVLYEASGDRPPAFRMLENALDISHREGYEQLFLSEWDIAEPVFQQYVKHRQAKPHSVPRHIVSCCDRLLLLAAEREERAHPLLAARKLLTSKEYKVLQSLIAGQSNAAIAGELSVGIETVKTHCKSIYKKLSLKSRKDAGQRFAAYVR